MESMGNYVRKSFTTSSDTFLTAVSNCMQSKRQID